MHRDALHIPGRATPSVHVFAEFLRDRNRPALAIDADEDELRAGNESVVSYPSRRLTHGKTGAPMMGEELLKAEDIAGKGSRPVVDRPSSATPAKRPPGEHVHAGPPRQHLPAGPLEEAEERSLVEVAEGVAFVGVDDEVDLGDWTWV